MLNVNIAGVAMKNPVIAASGTFGFGLEYADLLDLNNVGAVAVKGLTLEPRDGNKGRRVAETPSGMLNAIGLENPGVEFFVRDILPDIMQYDVPVIANISGNTIEEYARMAEKLTVPGVAALEVNISCPNVKNGCLAFGVDAGSAAEVTRAVKNATTLPVMVKLSPNVTDVVSIAKAVEQAGADAISLINTLLGMAIDSRTWRPVIGNIVAGLSGPAVKPVALRMVWQVSGAVSVPVIGMGGIMTAEDAVEFLLAGASAISVGTASLVNPRAVADIAKGLEAYLQARKLNHVNDLVGQLKV